MIPRQPPRRPQLGFIYVPPLRVQGLSIAGEETVIQVPELDVCFDIGSTPKCALTSNFVALSHGHMDHAAGIAYYFSQRHFQGMAGGALICPPALEQPIHNIMQAWVGLEAQQTPYQVIPLPPGGEIEIKNNIFLRAFETKHTAPSQGYVVIERRSKLKPELQGQPQEKLIELKNAGEQITVTMEVPLVCYTGDTMMGPHFDREDVLESKILITECTFLEPGHRSKAAIGQHLHLDDIVEIVGKSKAEAIILTHLSRRTHMGKVNQWMREAIPAADRERVMLLMDGRANRDRYERQRAEAEAAEAQQRA